jgi:hypothetical protein
MIKSLCGCKSSVHAGAKYIECEKVYCLDLHGGRGSNELHRYLVPCGVASLKLRVVTA